MRLAITSMECFKVDGKPPEKLAFVEIQNDGRYVSTCNNGHKTITLLQQQKFEVLFEIGAYAILEGYYIEAVSSFNSSLERFYEFYINVIAIKRGIKEDIFNSSWKKVSNKSERQLGAFILVYTLEKAASPPLLREDKEIKFRNNVIHNGKIPTEKEALDYGDAVLKVIRPVLKELREKYGNSIQEMVSKHLMSNKKEGEGCSILCKKTILSLTVNTQDHNEQTLEDAIKGLIRPTENVV